ncbi:6-phosphogluconate dehydrogenase [Mycena metata]|uniref:3-hydroxyisobutyrate dehydrogenase n=1 Tax=Mycena metata TaxID=1033252 RepID=A0AAD7KDL2_9AGAR|nr:6-phosphogluconate dehydrogenase [Mycena metata]
MSDMDVDLPQHFKFGWVGLGAMGWPMANQLLKNSDAKLVVFDVDEKVLHQFAREAPDGRVEIASSAKQVADESACIFTIVPEGRHVKEVYLTPNTGILAANTSGKLLIDCSDLGNSKPAVFFDSPVSGGTAGAVNGTITFMVGMASDDPSFPLVQSILKKMGRSINPMGGRGLGLAAKLSNNYLSGIIALATSEAMNLGMKLGIEPKVLSDCFQSGSSANWVNSTVNPVPGVCPDAVTSKEYEGGFKVQLMEKDMKLAAAAARDVGANLVLGETAIEAYSSAASDPRFRGKDSRVVYKWLGGVDPRSERKS